MSCIEVFVGCVVSGVVFFKNSDLNIEDAGDCSQRSSGSLGVSGMGVGFLFPFWL
jgi:hypothetical protein